MRTSISEPESAPSRLRLLVEREARIAGFDAVAVTSPDSTPLSGHRLADFVAQGYHGSMDWIAETLERRSAPKALWPEVRSIIVLAMNYGPVSDPRGILERPDRGAISVYAQNRDYHEVIKGKLKGIAAKLASTGGCEVKVFVDTAPVMEKPLAEAAGIGWQGKHTNLVSRSHGSWLFLGTIFTTADLVADAADDDHCGSCRACLDACPTDAFPAPYLLDARRCISYLTIENKGPIPREFRAAIGNRIYGCDDCLAACPWNKFAQAASEAKLVARDDLRAPSLAHLLTLDDTAFRALFSGSPVKRIGRDRFLRNVLIAAGNSGADALIAPCLTLAGDPSPLVRGAAIWALSRLMPAGVFARLAGTRQDTEPEADVGDGVEPGDGGIGHARGHAVLTGGVFIFGAGYSGKAFATSRPDPSIAIDGTTRSERNLAALEAAGITPHLFDGGPLSPAIEARLADAEALVISIAPEAAGDPVINAARQTIVHAMPKLRWIGYLSTVGVYGDRDGAWTDEHAPCRPGSERSRMRVKAEEDWLALGRETGIPVAILRLSGIYGPGRNALVNLAEGTARRLVKEGQVFNRIHVADIAGALWHLSTRRTGGIFNVTDDLPAPPQDVVTYAASLMDVAPPAEIAFDTAEISAMARSFYAENKRVSNAALKATGYVFRYPDYKAAFDALWADGDWRGEGNRDARSPIRAS